MLLKGKKTIKASVKRNFKLQKGQKKLVAGNVWPQYDALLLTNNKN